MGENRYSQFKDKESSRIRVRKGSNQEFEPYMNEKAYPRVASLYPKMSGGGMFFSQE